LGGGGGTGGVKGKIKKKLCGEHIKIEEKKKVHSRVRSPDLIKGGYKKETCVLHREGWGCTRGNCVGGKDGVTGQLEVGR